METQIPIDLTAGVFTVLGALMGAGISLLKDWLNNRAQFRLEKLRLHDRDRIDAYKHLFAFTGRLSSGLFPLAEKKASAFQSTMKEHYFGKLEFKYVYFTDRIVEILEELEEQYVCMVRPELIPETEYEREEFLEKKLFELVQELREKARRGLRSAT